MRVCKKIRKARGEGGPEEGIVSWTWQDCGTHELRAAVAACIRSAQDQARHHFSVEEKGFMSPQPATLELGTINDFWGLEFSLRM